MQVKNVNSEGKVITRKRLLAWPLKGTDLCSSKKKHFTVLPVLCTNTQAVEWKSAVFLFKEAGL